MFDNLEISQKLYSLKSLLKDKEDVLLIESLIEKYKTEINVDVEYTKRELNANVWVLNNILKQYYKEPEYAVYDFNTNKVISINDEICDKVILFDELSTDLMRKYAILKIKNNKNKNELTRQNSILIQNIFIEEIQELITKIF
jgi:hypothetical protein